MLSMGDLQELEMEMKYIWIRAYYIAYPRIGTTGKVP